MHGRDIRTLVQQAYERSRGLDVALLLSNLEWGFFSSPFFMTGMKEKEGRGKNAYAVGETVKEERGGDYFCSYPVGAGFFFLSDL